MPNRLDADLYAQAGLPCYFTIRSARPGKPFTSARYASLIIDQLLERDASTIWVDVYCLMPDHLHFVATPRIDGASSLTFAREFKGTSSKLLHVAEWRGEVWQRGSYDHLIRRGEDLERIAKYILANPVRRGLCSEPEEYAWSGLRVFPRE